MTSRAPPLCSFFLLRVDRRSLHHFCCLVTRLRDTPSTLSVATPIKLFKDLPYVGSKALFLGWLSLHRMVPSSTSLRPWTTRSLRRILCSLTQQTRARCKWARRIARAKRHSLGSRTTPPIAPSRGLSSWDRNRKLAAIQPLSIFRLRSQVGQGTNKHLYRLI
jgi:hypothetical protein